MNIDSLFKIDAFQDINFKILSIFFKPLRIDEI